MLRAKCPTISRRTSYEGSPEQVQGDPSDEEEDEDVLDTEHIQAVFFAIQHMDLCKDQAWSFLAEWQKKRRTWSARIADTLMTQAPGHPRTHRHHLGEGRTLTYKPRHEKPASQNAFVFLNAQEKHSGLLELLPQGSF